MHIFWSVKSKYKDKRRSMGIDVDQWRARIGAWHAFTTGRPLVLRWRRQPSSAGKGREHDYKCASKTGPSGKRKALQQTLARHLFLPFVTLSTLVVAVGSRSEDLNNLRCRFTSAFLLPICLITTLLLVAGPEKCRSMDKRRNTPSQCCVIPILAILLIIAGDVELNPGPFKMGKYWWIRVPR